LHPAAANCGIVGKISTETATANAPNDFKEGESSKCVDSIPDNHSLQFPFGVKMKAALRAIENDIGLLHGLSNAIRKASIESQNLKAATMFKIEDDDTGELFKEKFAADLLKRKFPNSSEIIRERLASAMLLRRKRFLYRKSRQGKNPIRLPEAVRKVPTRAIPAPIKKPLPPQPTVKETTIYKATEQKSTQSITASQAATATTLDPERFRKAFAPSRVLTIKSIPLTHDDKLNFPPPPKVDGDVETICPYCFIVLSSADITDRRKWMCVHPLYIARCLRLTF
jgi:hypothetical protein